MTRAGSAHRRWTATLIVLMVALAGRLVSAGVGAEAQTAPTMGAPEFLKLTIDSVNPTTITTSSPAILAVAGTVTNIGDRVVDDISVRFQRAAAIDTASQLRSVLHMDQGSYDTSGPFQDVADRLAPGQRKQFTLRIGVRAGMANTGGDQPVDATLGITDPGVYPVLLNVNGAPAYGNQAHLDDARFLVPVAGLPALPPADNTKGPGIPPVSASIEAPVATTVLWPLADRPRLVAGVPGSVDGKALLTDDELAGELASGGRLERLLSALDAALHPDTDRQFVRAKRGLASALCLAVDPDLLLTVSAMTENYRVLASPSDPDGPTRDGIGTHAAKAWLNRLRVLASSLCTVALPFAQADPSAVAEINDPGLTARTIEAPADIVDSVLSVKSVRAVALPTAGSIDSDAAKLFASHGYTTAVLADNAVVPAPPPDALAPPEPAGPVVPAAHNAPAAAPPGTEADGPDMVQLPPPAPSGPVTTPPAAGALKVATFDIWSATALAAVGSNPPTPSFTPERVRYAVSEDSRVARLQDALGAVSWAALDPQAPRRSLLLMPPQQFSATWDEASALLNQVDLLFRDGLAAPRSFAELLTKPADPRPFAVNYLPEAADTAVPHEYMDPVQEEDHRIGELMSALVDVPQQEPTPRAFLTPLRDDLARVLSLSDRSGPAEQADIAARRRLDQTAHTLDGLYHCVTVLPPGGVYTLASEQSPLLLVARNNLPVAVRIRFRIDAPPDATITDIGEQQLPAQGARSFEIPTQVSDKRNLVIPISLTTPGAVPLGNATFVSVRSNAYGQTLAIMTACAGALLLLLAGRRLWRRFTTHRA